jgi:exopolysaccharide production protein ExoQ
MAMLAIASTMWSQFPTETLPRAIYLTVNVLFTFYLAARFPARRQMQLIMALGWIVVLSSIIAAVLFPQYGIDHQQEGAFGAWIGIFSHKNWCAIMVAFLLSGAFYLRPSSPLSRFSRIMFIALSLLVIAMSQSRTGWLVTACLLFYVGVTNYLKRYKSKEVLFIALFFAGVMIVGVALVVQNYTAMMLLMGKDPTLTGRTKIWTLVLHSISKQPLLGYGYRAFWHGLEGESANLSLADQWIVPAAHNGFLDLWLGLGALGVGMAIYSMLQAIRNGITCIRGGSSPAAEWYISIIVLTVVANIAELTLMVPDDLAWIIYVLACAGLAQQAKRIRLGLHHGEQDLGPGAAYPRSSFPACETPRRLAS